MLLSSDEYHIDISLYSLHVSTSDKTHLEKKNSVQLLYSITTMRWSSAAFHETVFICSFRYLPVRLAHSSRHPGCHQGFLAAVLAFPLGPVLIWVISTSVKASGGRHERMRSMVLW